VLPLSYELGEEMREQLMEMVAKVKGRGRVMDAEPSLFIEEARQPGRWRLSLGVNGIMVDWS
jgi:hypothetical protein